MSHRKVKIKEDVLESKQVSLQEKLLSRLQELHPSDTNSGSVMLQIQSRA